LHWIPGQEESTAILVADFRTFFAFPLTSDTRMKTKFLLLTLLLAVFGTSSATAAILYASHTPIGALDCSTTSDYCSLTVALGLAQPGDTIILEDGTYSGAGHGEIDIPWTS